MTLLNASFWGAIVLWLLVVLLGVLAEHLAAKKRHAPAQWISLAECMMCMLATMYTVCCFLS